MGKKTKKPGKGKEKTERKTAKAEEKKARRESKKVSEDDDIDAILVCPNLNLPYFILCRNGGDLNPTSITSLKSQLIFFVLF